MRNFADRLEAAGDLWAPLRKSKGADLRAVMKYAETDNHDDTTSTTEFVNECSVVVAVVPSWLEREADLPDHLPLQHVAEDVLQHLLVRQVRELEARDRRARRPSGRRSRR